MQDKIIILKNTKNGIVKDTIVTIQDTINMHFENLVKLKKPDENLVVHTIKEPMSLGEQIGLWVGIFLGAITIFYTLYSIYKLRQSDKDTQEQLDKLSGIVVAIEAQNGIITEGNTVMRDYFAELQTFISSGSGSGALAEIENKRFRLSVKPRLYIPNSGYAGYSYEIWLNLANRGELCFYDGYEFIEGDEVEFKKWKEPIEIKKDARIELSGKSLVKHPKDLVFKMKIYYHDQEGFEYESIIEWKGRAKIIETIEL
ncbi:hypothetical protein [Flagellimonas halotolerans]|uniref:DUF4178 domain-containing protein n=1 Tax=Flagellimonas halotolerans TaxID=3112164 RepID=A0ABU6ITC9_9FLAO|nr:MULTISPECIES: hypothetical protein [unclassified Allomuricauda]MEC3966465.1 hypothetical protein [Muricauda sp. SYSU M86414]MEC4266398.1 hypothetical protein [Muricauda sp. SYSU M84420]